MTQEISQILKEMLSMSHESMIDKERVLATNRLRAVHVTNRFVCTVCDYLNQLSTRTLACKRLAPSSVED
jgi:hypothetical protein